MIDPNEYRMEEDYENWHIIRVGDPDWEEYQYQDDEGIPDAFVWEYDWRCPDCGDKDCEGGCHGVYDGP